MHQWFLMKKWTQKEEGQHGAAVYCLSLIHISLTGKGPTDHKEVKQDMNKYELALVVSAKVEDEVRDAVVEKAKMCIRDRRICQIYQTDHGSTYQINKKDRLIRTIVVDKFFDSIHKIKPFHL